jgi:hypothetical protein
MGREDQMIAGFEGVAAAIRDIAAKHSLFEAS